MYSRIMIIGLGSVGSFVAQGLSYLEGLKKLILIDHDSVEQSNLSKSVYPSKYVGKNKALALKEILSNTTDAKLEAYQIKISETEFTKKDIDLIIDCRDIITDKNIDSVKVSISDRILLIDGRKISYGKTIQGAYISEVNVLDLMNVSNIISRMVRYNSLKDLINKGEILQIPLDSDKSEIEKRLSSVFDKTKTDIVYDSIEDTKLSNMDEVVQKISTLKEDSQIEIELVTGAMNETCIVNKRNFNSTYEIIEFISNLIKSKSHENFVVYTRENKIIVTPEVGAA